jgi:hypothetical protein
MVGSTTFGIPFFPIGYAALAGGSGTIGTETAGQVIAHTHSNPNAMGSGSWNGSAGIYGGYAFTSTTGSTGGAFNAAAGAYVQKCIKY